MDIIFETQKFIPYRQDFLDASEQLIKNKLGGYSFINVIKVNIENLYDEGYKISFLVSPTKGKVIYAEAQHLQKKVAMNTGISKVKTQLEKYKEIHYSSSKKSKGS